MEQLQKGDHPSGEVFVPYSAANKDLADWLSGALAEAGHPTWVDTEDIRYAENWRTEVLPAVSRAPAVVFITSEASRFT